MVDPQRWRRIGELFEICLEMPPADRAARLEAVATQEDPDLAARVTELLEAHDSAPDFLEEGAFAEIEGGAEDPVRVGAEVGPYKLIEELGRGGMGTVYRASRADQSFRQRVAVKVIRRGMGSDEIVRRFVNERQILAGLVHPNIARLLDGGTTSDGRPYFVMELIDGRPLTEAVRERGIDLEERLRLFLSVCSALAFAHGKLVVHRDLKPANVLLTSEGQPKLLDFGIAKLLGPDLAGRTLVPTRFDAQPMTPEFASPEQARGEPVTTATDVWGLGLLLYELIADRHPFVAPGETVALARVEERAREADFELPSHTLRRSPSGAAGDRRLRRRSRRSRGDLDAIVALALDPEPQRRYPSVTALAADVERFLEARPVRARRAPLWDRSAKLLRRHKIAATFVLLLLAFSAMMIGQGLEVARQRDRAREGQRGAEALSRFLTGIFQLSDPERSRGETVTARELLDAGAAQLLSAGDQLDSRSPSPLVAADLENPATRGDLLETIGVVYNRMGLVAEAETVLIAAEELRRSGGGATELDLAETLVQLGHVQRGLGRFDEARQNYEESLEIRRRRLGEESRPVAATLHGLGLLERSAGAWDAAEARLLRAVEIRRRHLTEEPVELAQSLSNLAAVAIDRRQPEAAVAPLAEARELYRQAYGEEDPGLVPLLSRTAALLFRQGETGEAVQLFGEVCEARRRFLGPDHPDLAVALTNLGRAQHVDGDRPAAESSYREALAILHRAFDGEAHPDVAYASNNLAVLLEEEQRWEEAEGLYLRAIDVYRSTYDGAGPYLAQAIRNLAVFEQQRGRPERGVTLLRESLAIMAKAPEPDLKTLAKRRVRLARMLIEVGSAAEAKRAFEVSARQLFDLPDGGGDALEVAVEEAEWHAREKRPGPAAAALRGILDLLPAKFEIQPELQMRIEELRAQLGLLDSRVP